MSNFNYVILDTPLLGAPVVDKVNQQITLNFTVVYSVSGLPTGYVPQTYDTSVILPLTSSFNDALMAISNSATAYVTTLGTIVTQ
jgi:hypothetical protein